MGIGSWMGIGDGDRHWVQVAALLPAGGETKTAMKDLPESHRAALARESSCERRPCVRGQTGGSRGE